MVGDPRPAFCLAKNIGNVAKGELAKHPQFKNFLVGLFHRVQDAVNLQAACSGNHIRFRWCPCPFLRLLQRGDALLYAKMVVGDIFGNGTKPSVFACRAFMG